MIDKIDLNLLPEWQNNSLGELGEFKNGINKGKEDFGFGTKFVNIENCYGSLVLNTEGLGRLNANEKEIEIYRLIDGDIVLVRSSVKPEGVGYPVLYLQEKQTEDDILYCGFTIRFRLNEKTKIDPKYLTYLLRDDLLRNEVMKYSTVSANTNINQDSYSRIRVVYPPLPEQKKIAKILSTVDGHIDEVDGMIEDLKELKKGLMQKLLTEGIGHTEFKDSEVGRIPVEWEVKKLDDISTLMTNGFVGTASPYYTTADSGTKYLQSNNVRMNRIDTTKMVYVNDEFVEQYPKTRVFEGDMLTVQSGHIGTSCIVPTEYDNCNCHALIITRFDKQKVYPGFVSHYLNSHNGQNRLSVIFVGSTIKHINVKDFKKIVIPVPPINEQEQIASIINSVDNRIDIQYAVLEQYKELKKGLMQKLLTGKTRVKIDN